MIVCFNNNIFIVYNDLNCLFFKALLEENIDSIDLYLFQDIFMFLFENKTIDDFINKFEINYLYKGLTYFGSNLEHDLVYRLYNNILKFETSLIKEPIINIFENNLHLINWTSCCSSTFLSEDFFIRHLDKVDWFTLSDNHILSLNFYKQFENRIIWQHVGSNPNLSVEIIEKHIDTINWDRISINKKLDISFFEKYIDKINWLWISSNPSIPIEFINKYQNRIHWNLIKNNKNITLKFFEDNMDRIKLENIVQNYNITLEFLEKHKEKFNFHCWALLLKNSYTPSCFIENNIDIIKKYDLFKYVSMNTNIDLNFASQNIHKLDWNLLMSNPKITIDFLNEHKIQIKPYYYALNPNININEIDKYLIYSNIYSNTFNIKKKVLIKIKNTKYFDFEQLNSAIKKFIKN